MSTDNPGRGAWWESEYPLLANGLHHRTEIEGLRASLQAIAIEFAKAKKPADLKRIEAEQDRLQQSLRSLERYVSELEPEEGPASFEQASFVLEQQLEYVEDAFVHHLEFDKPWNDPEGGFSWRDSAAPWSFAWFAFWLAQIANQLRTAEPQIVRKSRGPSQGIIFQAGEWAAVSATWHMVAFELLLQVCFDTIDISPSRRSLARIRRLRSRVMQERLIVCDSSQDTCVNAEQESLAETRALIASARQNQRLGKLHWDRYEYSVLNPQLHQRKALAEALIKMGDKKCTAAAVNNSLSLARKAIELEKQRRAAGG